MSIKVCVSSGTTAREERELVAHVLWFAKEIRRYQPKKVEPSEQPNLKRAQFGGIKDDHR